MSRETNLGGSRQKASGGAGLLVCLALVVFAVAGLEICFFAHTDRAQPTHFVVDDVALAVFVYDD